jgi:hypothetical protein
MNSTEPGVDTDALRNDLADLASTCTVTPDPVPALRQGVRRRARRRRAATGAVVGLVLVALVTLVAARPGSGPVAVDPLGPAPSQPSPTRVPACAAVPPGSQPVKPLTPTPSGPTASANPDGAASPLDGPTAAHEQPPVQSDTDTSRVVDDMKARGVVDEVLGPQHYLVSTPADSRPAGVPVQFTLVVDANTSFSRGATTCTGLQLAAGDELGLKATRNADGSYEAVEIGVP